MTTYRGLAKITRATKAFWISKSADRFVGQSASVEVVLEGDLASARVIEATGALSPAKGQYVRGMQVTTGNGIALTHDDKNVSVRAAGEFLPGGSLLLKVTATAKSLLVRIGGGIGTAEATAMLEPVQEQPAPVPGLVAPGPIGRPVLVGSLTYAWPQAVRADTIASELEAVRAVGASGITMELGGPDIRLGAECKDWKRSFAQMCEWAPEVIATALNRGLMVLFYVWNTNGPGKGYRPSWKAADAAGNRTFIRDQVRELLKRMPADPRLLVVPYSEEDDSTHPSIMAELAALCRELVPHDRLVSTGAQTSWAKWADIHPQRLGDIKPQSDNTIITSDSNIIGQLFEGGTWGTTPKPIVDKCVQFAKENDDAGILAFYTTGTAPTAIRYQAEWQAVIRQVSGGGGAQPGHGGTGPRIEALRPYTKGAEARIEFKLSGIEGWPVEVDKGNGKRLKGWIEINGVLVESFREGQTDQHLGNAWDTGGHGIKILPGEPARFRFVSRDRKSSTDALTIAWPFKKA